MIHDLEYLEIIMLNLELEGVINTKQRENIRLRMRQYEGCDIYEVIGKLLDEVKMRNDRSTKENKIEERLD